MPMHLVDQFRDVYAWRNQVEGYFSWLERCYRHKDRAASWGHDRQVLDMIGAALLHNTVTYAHLERRHPEVAQSLRDKLAGTQGDDTDAARTA